MARAQHGVLTRRDLEGLGFSKMAIEHRVSTGRLHLITRGVYAVGRRELTARGRWMAAVLKILRLERAVNEADKLDLVDPETLRKALDAYTGMPGVKTLRTMLDRHTFRLSDSDLEILFRPLARAAAFPPPLTKHWVLGYETDGLRYHRTPFQQPRAARSRTRRTK